MKSLELPQQISTASCPRPVCESCGEAFTCGAQDAAGCWCAEVKLTAEALESLRERYKSCLCRACLERLALAAPDGEPNESEKIFG